MIILYLTLILAAIYPFLLFWDHRTARNPETGEYKAQRISDSFALFAPFALLYYHEAFWHNLIFYFIPLYVYFLLLAWVMQKKFKLASAFDMLLSLSVGSFMLVIIGYYIFFHQGVLAPEDEVVKVVEPNQMGLWIWWPIAAAILSVVMGSVLLKVIGEKAEKLLFYVAFILLILPFFSHHPYWAMLLSTGLFFCFCLFAAKQGDSTGSGAYAALFYFYLLAQMMALIVYAIFF